PATAPDRQGRAGRARRLRDGDPLRALPGARPRADPAARRDREPPAPPPGLPGAAAAPPRRAGSRASAAPWRGRRDRRGVDGASRLDRRGDRRPRSRRSRAARPGAAARGGTQRRQRRPGRLPRPRHPRGDRRARRGGARGGGALRHAPPTGRGAMRSLVLATVSRGVLPVTALFALFLLLRGHDEPGGGFVAGLVTASAIVLQALTFGARETERLLAPLLRPALPLGLLL